MFKNLPNDVVKIIADYVLFSPSHCNMFLLSKYYNKQIKKMRSLEAYKSFVKRVHMMRYDRRRCTNIDKGRYEKIWEHYNKYKWPELLLQESKSDFKMEYEVGEVVDVKDFVQAWCPAKIISKKIDMSVSNDKTIYDYIKYSVQFLGWSDRFDENVSRHKIASFTKFTLNPRDKFSCLMREEFDKFWCFAWNKNRKKWTSEIITKRIINENNDTIILIDSNSNDYYITKSNIDDNICVFSNATAFLTNSLHGFLSRNRKFFY